MKIKSEFAKNISGNISEISTSKNLKNSNQIKMNSWNFIFFKKKFRRVAEKFRNLVNDYMKDPISKPFRTRFKKIIELIKSERSYVEKLTLLVHVRKIKNKNKNKKKIKKKSSFCSGFQFFYKNLVRECYPNFEPL